MVEIRFTLNGDSMTASVRPAQPAVQLLRDGFGLTGPKPGRNVWANRPLGQVDKQLSMGVPSHGAQLLRIGE